MITIQNLKSLVPPFLISFISKLHSSPLKKRLAQGAYWSLAGAIASRVTGLLASILAARLLGKELFGELGIVLSTIEMVSIFASFGMGITATKYVAELRENEPVRAGRVIALSSLMGWITGCLGTIILLSTAPWLAKDVLAAPHLTGLLRVCTIGLLIGAVNGAQMGALSGLEAFKSIAKINIISGLLGFILRVAGVYWFGLEGAVAGFLFSQIISCVLSERLLRIECKMSGVAVVYTGCFKEAAVLTRFSIPAVLSGFLVIPVNWACSALLVNQVGGYAQMGIFNAANQWFNVLLFLPGLMGQVILPVLSHRIVARDYAESRKILFLALKINSLLLFPLALLALVSKPLMTFYGRDFSSGWSTLIVTLGTAGFLSIQMPIGYLLTATGKMWTVFLMNAGWAIACVVGTYFLLHHGALGLASARLISYALHAGWSFVYAYIVLERFKNNKD